MPNPDFSKFTEIQAGDFINNLVEWDKPWSAKEIWADGQVCKLSRVTISLGYYLGIHILRPGSQPTTIFYVELGQLTETGFTGLTYFDLDSLIEQFPIFARHRSVLVEIVHAMFKDFVDNFPTPTH